MQIKKANILLIPNIKLSTNIAQLKYKQSIIKIKYYPKNAFLKKTIKKDLNVPGLRTAASSYLIV